MAASDENSGFPLAGLMDIISQTGQFSNYDKRKIKNDKINEAIIDTCFVPDTIKGIETGISHPKYNNGRWIIVEEYSTKGEALIGHEKWVKIFTEGLPEVLNDVSTCSISQMAKELGVKLDKKFKRKSIKNEN
jgi:hypothetical protein